MHSVATHTRPKTPEEAQAYYDDRYTGQYADGWPAERYARIQDLIRSLDLPAKGRALDFGCGRGAMSRVIKDALPGWDVVGMDLSEVALREAERQAPDVTFISFSQLTSAATSYDFVFSHHVLEHVVDLDETLRLLASIVSPGGSMLHVLPCGNPGSLEHRMAALRVDGIDQACEGRFHCDDAPHLRRMTSDQLSRALGKQSFTLQKSWFGDHNWGARHSWSKKSIRDLWALTDLARAIDAKAASQLMAHRAAIVLAALLCKPTYYRWQVAHAHRSGQPWRAREVAAVACMLPLSLISTPIVRSLAALASREWEDRSSDPTGQEMFMYFRCAR